MFDIQKERLNTKTDQLLFNIWQELKAIKQLLQEEENDYSKMKRHELMAEVKKLENKPKGWTKFTNEQLIELLRGERDA